jgi:CheY-like chemotaxis protein
VAAPHVLLVEDEVLNSLYLKSQLVAMGLRVTALTTAEQALSSARSEPPDLVLMDINLSGEMDGLEAVRQLRAFLDVPVIFTTGYSDEGTREQAAALEPEAFLVKPLDMKALKRTVLAILARGR